MIEVSTKGKGVKPVNTDTVTLGKFLRGYLKRRGYTQAKLAETLGVDASYISQMVNGKVSWTASGYFSEIVKTLNISAEEVKEIKPDAFIDFVEPTELEREYAPRAVEMTRLIRHCGSVGAGLWLVGASEYPDFRAFPRIPGLESYADDELFALDVIGDSMTCEATQKTISEGSLAIFLASSDAQMGDIVAVWLERQQRGVLKIYDKQGGHIVLRSYNNAHKPIILEPDEPATIQGIYLTHVAPIRRRGRKL